MASAKPLAKLRSDLEAWAKIDPWVEHRERIGQWLHELSDTALSNTAGPAFSSNLKFGTAGMRAVVGPGPARINAVTVARVSWAVAESLKRQGNSACTVVIGFDGRVHSQRLAEVAKSVFAQQGLKVLCMQRPTATPVLAYAVRHLKASAGVMITASHNPPEYNGYKLYDAEGVQVRSPWDADIETLISKAPASLFEGEMKATQFRDVQSEVESAYKQRVLSERLKTQALSKDINIAYTALHGVGEPLMRDLFKAAGYLRVVSVDSQAEPDGRFPTVAFPNPEIPSALALLRKLAIYSQADVGLANDPDADRLAVLMRDGRGSFHALTGNEIGALLSEWVLGQTDHLKNRCVITTHVSSPLIDAIARHHGAACLRTPTGFKWIAGEGLKQQREGRHFVFGFEEALGFLLGGKEGVWSYDKDGLSAVLAIADCVAALKAKNRTLQDVFERLGRLHGLWVSHTMTRRFSESELMRASLAQRMHYFRSSPPERLLGLPVAVYDFLNDSPSVDMLRWQLSDRSRVMVRPSGTEPLIKIYLDVCEDIADNTYYEEAHMRALQRLSKLQRALTTRIGKHST